MEDRRKREAEVRQVIYEQLEKSGELEGLKNMLRQRLVECGWRDELKKFCRERIRAKGLEHVTVEELVADITPQGRATVPDSVKEELLSKIRKFIESR